jgi:hypothetical protein
MAFSAIPYYVHILYIMYSTAYWDHMCVNHMMGEVSWDPKRRRSWAS